MTTLFFINWDKFLNIERLFHRRMHQPGKETLESNFLQLKMLTHSVTGREGNIFEILDWTKIKLLKFFSKVYEECSFFKEKELNSSENCLSNFRIILILINDYSWKNRFGQATEAYSWQELKSNERFCCFEKAWEL